MATAQTNGTHRKQLLELAGGWSGDLAWSGGSGWLVWSACQDPEPHLLSAITREWPLRPDATVAGWRRQSANATFTVSLARLGADGALAEARELTRTPHAIEGPAAAALPGRATPAVLWVERRGRSAVLLATVDGRTVEVVAEAAGAMLGPRAAVDAGGRLWAVWQQWPPASGQWSVVSGQEGQAAGPPSRYRTSPQPPAPSPQIVAAVREAKAPPGAATAWSAPVPVSSAGQSAWAPALAAGPDGALWCAWDAWDSGTYQIYLRYALPDGTWGQPLQVSSPPSGRYGGHFSLAPDVAVVAGQAWVVWSRTPRWGQLNHRFNHTRSLHAAVVTVGADGSLAAAPAPGQPVLGEPGRLPVPSIPFLHSVEEEFINPLAPRVRLGPDHRPVVFFRQFRSAEFKDFGWTICAVRHTGQDWLPPVRLSTHTGFPDAPYGAAPGGEEGAPWLLAYHAGEYPLDPAQHPSKPVSRHRLVVERVPGAQKAESRKQKAVIHGGSAVLPSAFRLPPSGAAPAPSPLAS